MKKKLNVRLHKAGSENNSLTRLIANYNEGKSQISPRDLEGYFMVMNGIYTNIGNYLLVKDTEPNTYHVSEDGGETFTMTIEWVEVFELVEDTPNELFTQSTN